MYPHFLKIRQQASNRICFCTLSLSQDSDIVFQRGNMKWKNLTFQIGTLVLPKQTQLLLFSQWRGLHTFCCVVVLISELMLLTGPLTLTHQLNPVTDCRQLNSTDGFRWLITQIVTKKFFFFFIHFLARDSERFNGNYLVFFCPALNSDQLEPIKKSVE